MNLPDRAAIGQARNVVAAVPTLLKSARFARGDSLRAAAAEIGCHFQTLHSIEHGAEVKTKLLLGILKYLEEDKS